MNLHSPLDYDTREPEPPSFLELWFPFHWELMRWVSQHGFNRILVQSAKCVTQFPLLARSDYPGHRPLVGSIPLDWKVWLQSPNTRSQWFSHCNKQPLAQEQKSNSDVWCNLIQQTEHIIHQAGTQSFPDLLGRINSVTKNWIPPRPSSKVPLWIEDNIQSLVADKWMYLRQARSTSRSSNS